MERAWVQQKHNDESISQQAARAMLSSSLPTHSREQHCFCLPTMSTQNATRERKKTRLIIKHGSLETITSTQQQVLSGDKTQKWVLSSMSAREVNRSIMMWYGWSKTGAEHLKATWIVRVLVKLGGVTAGRHGPPLCCNRQVRCYLLIDSKWGIFGREILGVHGSLHHHRSLSSWHSG